MSYTEWKIPYEYIDDSALRGAGVSPLLAAVLARRGFADIGEAQKFIECSAELLGDPLTMTDMPDAVRRLDRAVKTGERIAVYGDYDVDGITSSCLLSDYLRCRGADCEIYIPDRQEEGYGLNTGAIDTLHQRGVSLIVTVDCGVTAIEETAYASTLGVDMIITDHHECQEVLPDAVAVVDPKRPDCNYPSRDLAGVGVAFKLLCAMEGSADKVLERYADLVAVGTIADVMPITGENRYIIKAGLEKLTAAPRPGLKALIEESGLAGRKISATNVGFTLAPRLNASGRLGQASMAAELLMTSSHRDAESLASDLCQLNRDRQSIEMDIWNDALAMLGSKRPDHPIVLAHEGWHQGVIGIAASRLTEAYNVPAIMICLDGEHGKGSCRSYGGFNLFEALSECSEYLDGFGGHALAAGLTIKRENVDAFRTAIARYYDEHPPCRESVLQLDLRVDSPELLTMECVEDLDYLEPCGNGNPSAQVCLCRAQLTAVNPIGGGKHLKMKMEKFGREYEAVFFSKTADKLGAKEGDWIDAAFLPQINEFRSHRSVQFLMTDLRQHDESMALGVLGGEIPPMDAPAREDFIRAWRALGLAGGGVSGGVCEVLESLCPEMTDGKLCLCLKVFEELKLINMDISGGTLTAARNPGADKVNLADSQILRSLGK